MDRKYVLEDHLCRKCGGRILRCVAGAGMTPGGNPIYRCADCGVATSASSPNSLCWCGFSHRMNACTAYRCLPFSILDRYPELRTVFAECGCDPSRGEVGIVLETSLGSALKEAGEAARLKEKA